MALIFCITIIGIPFGKMHFRLAKLALSPFGKELAADIGHIEQCPARCAAWHDTILRRRYHRYLPPCQHAEHTDDSGIRYMPVLRYSIYITVRCLLT